MRYLILSFLFSFSAYAGTATPMQFNFSGQLTDSFDSPIVNKTVELKLEILNPLQDCLLYQETQNVLTSSDGKFAITIGGINNSGGYRSAPDPGLFIYQVFDNSQNFLCGGTPQPGDGRKLRVTIVRVGTDPIVNDVLAVKDINAVPYAIAANTANDIQGKLPTDFVNVNTAGSFVLTQTNLENIFTLANYSTLTSLIAGTSAVYSKPAANGTSLLPNIAAPVAPAAGQVWYDAGTIKYYDGLATQTLRTAGALVQADIPTLTVAGKVSGDAITSGTITGTTAINTTGAMTTTGAITTSGNIVGGAISANLNESRILRVFEPIGDGTNYTEITVTALTANIPWILPTTQGGSGTVLTNNGSGTLSWTTPGGAGVASFNSRTGVVTPAANDYTWAQVNKATSSFADITTRSAADISSGELNDGRLSLNVVLKDVSNIFSIGGQEIQNAAPGIRPLVIRGAVAQSASLTDWTANAGTLLYGLDATGVPTATTDLANKDYVDVSVGSYVLKAGDTMTGGLAINTNSASSSFAVTQSGAGPAASIMGGNVGIGTATPSTTLEVAGTLKVTGATSLNNGLQSLIFNGDSYTSPGTAQFPGGTVGIFDNINPTDGTYSGIALRPRNTAFNYQSAYFGAISNAGAGVNTPSIVIGQQTGAATYLERLRIDSSGNVGIGTANPSTPLSVVGEIKATGPLSTTNSGYGIFQDNGSIKLVSYIGAGYGVLGTESNHKLALTVNNSDRMTILPNGNVGIGMNLPATKLDISGPTITGALNTGLVNLLSTWNTTGNPTLIKANVFNTASGATSNLMDLQVGGTSRFKVDKNGTVIMTGGAQVGASIIPLADGTMDLGSGSFKFNNIYLVNTPIISSDSRLKTGIEDSDLGLEFVNSLRPVSYYVKNGNGQLHYGVVAQEAIAALAAAKKANGREHEVENVIVTRDKESDAYGVRYTEFIAPLIKAIQEIAARLVGVEQGQSTLSSRVEQLEKENHALKSYLCAKDPNAPVCN